jgi:sugar phosphate isomerase/epimerase
MRYRLACADFTFPLLEHEHALKLIGMLGFDGVDIGLFEGRSHLWPSREFADVGRSAAPLRSKLDSAGLRAADVFLQMDPDFTPYAINQPDAARRKKARDWFVRALEYAGACGCRHVTTLPGVHFEEESLEASFGRAADELAWRVEQSARHAIVFGVEAHVGSIAPTPQQALRLVESVPGLTLTLDYTHFTRAGLPDAAVHPLLAHASHFHVRGAREGRLQASFAENAIDYDEVARRMDAVGYSGWIGIEYVWIDWEHCNECDNLSETVRFRDQFRGLSAERADGSR